MAYTSYITIDGMLIGEETNGVMRNYGTDALGSVVTTTLNGVAENTYRYKPYGGLLAKTGTANDPSFLWNGGSGYRATTLADSTHYVRRRHFSSTAAQWPTADPSWPKQPPYLYAKNCPVLLTDSSGLRCTPWPSLFQSSYSVKLTMPSENAVADIKPSGSEWSIIAVLDVSFLCTVSLSPCACPVVGDGPQIWMEQWFYDGPVQTNPTSWTLDSSPSCGPSVGDGCVITQQGRDLPGFAKVGYTSPATSCAVTLIGLLYSTSDLPISDEAHFVTVCNPRIGYVNPPVGYSAIQYWGYTITVEMPPGGSKPVAEILPTFP